MYWLIGPVMHHESAHLSWIDLTTFIGIGGIFIALFWNRFTQKRLFQ